MKGIWKFYDTGDNEIIQLIDDSSKSLNQCFVGIKDNLNHIKVLNPNVLLNNDSLESLEFIASK